MDILPLDQQKKAILYAPKDLLWKILDEEDAWLKLFKLLPEEYYTQFLERLRLTGSTEPAQIRTLARVYITDKVRLDHLQEAIVSVWNPSDLEEATSWLKANDFLNRPFSPLNLQAETASEIEEVLAEVVAMPQATKLRIARASKGTEPKVGNPPDGASPEAASCWNSVLKDPRKRKIIKAPKSLHDQWALAHKFWLRECARRGVPAYVGPASGGSHSMHATNSLKRSIKELHTSLCHDGYSMSRPASRLLKKLYDQLVADGYDLGSWSVVRPKTPKGI